VSFSAGIILGEVRLLEKGHLAFFGELDYEIYDLRYDLSTQVQMIE